MLLGGLIFITMYLYCDCAVQNVTCPNITSSVEVNMENLIKNPWLISNAVSNISLGECPIVTFNKSNSNTVIFNMKWLANDTVNSFNGSAVTDADDKDAMVVTYEKDVTNSTTVRYKILAEDPFYLVLYTCQSDSTGNSSRYELFQLVSALPVKPENNKKIDDILTSNGYGDNLLNAGNFSHTGDTCQNLIKNNGQSMQETKPDKPQSLQNSSTEKYTARNLTTPSNGNQNKTGNNSPGLSPSFFMSTIGAITLLKSLS